MKTVPLVGYSSKLSGRPGDHIDFMVSSELDADYTAKLFRSISADPNPAGAGLLEQGCEAFFCEQSFPSRRQKFWPGSHGVTPSAVPLAAKRTVGFSVLIYSTLRCATEQSILDYGRYGIALNARGAVVLRADAATVSSAETVALRR